MIGTVIENRYQVETLISRNNLLETFSGKDQSSNRRILIISLRPEATSDPGISQGFHQKAESFLKINHPNLASGTSRGIHEQRPYLIYEAGKGTSLQDHIARISGGLSFASIIKIVRGIFAGLETLHKKGLVHAALNSINILIQPDDGVTLTGFQFMSNSGNELGDRVVEIIPPEFISGKDPAIEADIFSIGVVLFEMFGLGEKPFDGNQAPISGTLLQRIRWEQVNKGPRSLIAVNPTVPNIVEDIVFKCLHKEPIKRYHNLNELSEALENAYRTDKGEADPAAMETLYDMPDTADELSGGEATIVDDSEFIDFQQFSQQTIASAPVPGEDLTIVDEISPLPVVDDFAAYEIPDRGADSNRQKKSRRIMVIGGIIAVLVICCAVLPAVLYFTLGDSIELPQLGAVIEEDPAEQITQTFTVAALPTNTNTPMPSATNTVTATPTVTNTSTITSTPTPAYVMGDSMVREADSMEMMYVPAGEFLMGAHETLPDYADNHSPEHTVYLDAFWMDKYEVSNLQYQQCIDAGGCSGSVSHQTEFYYHHPVGSITWHEAQEYCEWAGGRLATEAEWEKAARGTDGSYYPWGNSEPNCDQAQFKGCGGTSSEAGKNFEGASEYGIEHLSGNVWEWVYDWYAGKYYQYSPAENPTGPEEGNKKVLRGGSWNNNPGTFMLTYYRGWNDPNNTYQDYGFRCVVPLAP